LSGVAVMLPRATAMLAVAVQLPAVEVAPEASVGVASASNAQRADQTDLLLIKALPRVDERREDKREIFRARYKTVKPSGHFVPDERVPRAPRSRAKSGRSAPADRSRLALYASNARDGKEGSRVRRRRPDLRPSSAHRPKAPDLSYRPDDAENSEVDRRQRLQAAHSSRLLELRRAGWARRVSLQIATIEFTNPTIWQSAAIAARGLTTLSTAAPSSAAAAAGQANRKAKPC
jgi:hypothetical protein